MAFNTNLGAQSFTASASQTVFDFNFKIYNLTDLKVFQTASGATFDVVSDVLTYEVDYTVTIDGDNGGTVTLVTGATLNDTIKIVRNLPRTRTTSYITNGDLKAATLNEDQGYQTHLIIDGFNGTLSLPRTDITMSPELPTAVAGQYLRVKSDSTGFEYQQLDGFITEDQTLTLDVVSELTQALGNLSVSKVAIVKDLDRGGTFIYDSSKVGEDNQGTNFNGWIRQYSGDVHVKWFDSFTNAINAFAGTEGTGFGANSVTIDLDNTTVTLNSDVKVPINISIINGTINGSFKLVFRNPYIDNTSLRGYTTYWAYMKTIVTNVKFGCVVVINNYIGLKFADCYFAGVVLVNSNTLWTEYSQFSRCSFGQNASIGGCILFDGNNLGASPYSYGSGAGTADGSFGYTSFRDCKIDSAAPGVGIKLIGFAVPYNGTFEFKGYTRGNEGAFLYIVHGRAGNILFNVHLESFGASANIISVEDNGAIWYCSGNIKSASPEMKMIQTAGADLRGNNINVIGCTLADNYGDTIFQGDTYNSIIRNNVSQRDFTLSKKPMFKRTITSPFGFNSNVTSVISFENNEFDTLSNTSYTTFTCSIRGHYYISALIGLNTTSSALAAKISLFKNGAENIVGTLTKSYEDPRLIVNTLLYLQEGDTIDVRVYVFDNGGVPSVINKSQFLGYLI